jgi:flagellin-like protein
MVVEEFSAPLVVTVLVIVDSKDAYDRALAEITTTAMTIAIAILV